MRDKMAACAETTRGVTSSVLTHAHNAKCNLPRDTCLWYSVYTMTPCLKKLLKALLIIILKTICHCLDADFNSSYDIRKPYTSKAQLASFIKKQLNNIFNLFITQTLDLADANVNRIL